MTMYICLAGVAYLVRALHLWLRHRFEMAAIKDVKTKDRAAVLRGIAETRRAARPFMLVRHRPTPDV